ncbi:MAG: hypothetical protein KY410_04490 [Proteobacteria bacterium]|nr:hypothetical protein [Pseudomonadota bacterium]
MNKKDTTYRMPEGFNPYSAIDAARGLTDSVRYMLHEGAGAEPEMRFADKVSLDALAELLRKQVHALHDYIHEIGNSTALHLPMSDADFDALKMKYAKKDEDEVKEERALYLVRH